MIDILETYYIVILIYIVVLTTTAAFYLYFNSCKERYSRTGPPHFYIRYKKYCTATIQICLVTTMHLIISIFVVFVGR